MAAHVLTVERWVPAGLNRLLGTHWGRRCRPKRFDRAVIAAEALAQGVPKAAGKRCVHVEVRGWPRGRLPDPDNLLKSLLDGLVRAGLLVDDGPAWCELGTVRVERAAIPRTTIVLEALGG